MDHLLRNLAPITEGAWAKIEDEVKQTLKTMLAGRRLVDFKGPLGWQASAVATGRSESIATPPATHVEARLRHALHLVELRAPFALLRSELAALDRGARDADIDPAIAAARKIAMAENRVIFAGYEAAGIRGLCEAAPDAPLKLGDDVAGYPALIATAVNRLRDRGIDGPFAVALSEFCYTALTDATQAGYPVLDHVRRLIDGPIVWAPGLQGAVVLSVRGDDFELTVGQDLSIGYLSHDQEHVRLYIEESLTFWNITPQAAVPLMAPAAK